MSSKKSAVQISSLTGEYKQVQGDVVLYRVSALPETAKKLESPYKVLQQSETSGHHHQFKTTAAVELYYEGDLEVAGTKFITPNKQKYIVVGPEGAELFHGRAFEYEPHKTGTGDHNSQMVPPGVYRVDIKREYDYDSMEVRRVVD